MRIYVITACYNYLGKLDKYVDSFNRSFSKHKDDLEDSFYFIFVNDQPETEDKISDILEKLVKDDRINYEVICNKVNIGATRSRNKAARRAIQFEDEGRVIYFDSDDIWTEDAVKILSDDLYNDIDLVFHPVNVSSIPINNECREEMTLSKFCTFIPLQECIYSWKLSWAREFISKHGFLWYEDDSDSKYFPEDMMFYLIPNQEVWVTDKIICDRNYETGNIAHDWEFTILKNKSAFRTLVKMHRMNMKTIEYPAKLIEYVKYLEHITK